jgi:hypothetical protein
LLTAGQFERGGALPATPSHITLAVGDGARRMTYAALAAVRGISLPSARRLVLRHYWSRQTGNDRVVRVTVPLTALAKGAETARFCDNTTAETVSHATDTTTAVAVPLTDPVTVTLTHAIDSLREQLVIASGRADRAERRIDELQATLAEERRRLIEILTESRRPWWRRWFG